MPGVYTTVEEVLEHVVEPLVRQDGGELFLVELSEQHVSLHLRGRFSGCPGNTLAIRKVIEPALHAVAPSMRVSISSGELVPEQAKAWSSQPQGPSGPFSD